MPAPMIQAVVFDLDGLMLNTEDVFELAGQRLLERRGQKMTTDIRRRMLGRRPQEAFEALIEETGITDPIPDLMQETKILFYEIAESHLAMMAGLPELLDHLTDRRLPMAVATSSPQDYLNGMLDRFDLQKYFQFTLAAEDVTRGKPDPEIYKTAARTLKINASSILVLEDSEAGTQAAVAADTYAVAVPHQHSSWGDFTAAKLVADSLADPRIFELL